MALGGWQGPSHSKIPYLVSTTGPLTWRICRSRAEPGQAPSPGSWEMGEGGAPLSPAGMYEEVLGSHPKHNSAYPESCLPWDAHRRAEPPPLPFLSTEAQSW